MNEETEFIEFKINDAVPTPNFGHTYPIVWMERLEEDHANHFRAVVAL
jgi:hypothetical protein